MESSFTNQMIIISLQFPTNTIRANIVNGPIYISPSHLSPLCYEFQINTLSLEKVYKTKK